MSLLLLKKQKKYYKLQLKLFVDGIMRVKSVLSELHPTYEDTILRIYKTLLVSIILMKRKKKSVTVECLPENKWMTLNDKKIFLNTNSLIISWLQMSVLGLIGKEKDLKPFWTNQCTEISQRLWLPTETDSVDSHLNFWSGSSNVMESNSWFSMKKKTTPLIKNSQMISSPSYMFIPVEKWDNEGIRIRTRKLRIYPNQKQQIQLKQWIGNRRFIYNRVLDKIKKGDEEINFFSLRNKYVTSKSISKEENWQLSTPKDIRAGAIRDIVKNYKTVFSQLKSRQINHFKMNFSSKKDSPSIEIPKTSLKFDSKGIFIYKTYIPDKIKIGKKQQKMKLNIDYDCRLQFKNNKWFLMIPIKTNVSIIKNRKEYCSLDPGIRSFQTVYSEDSVLQIKIKKEMIYSLQKKIDNFKSLRDRKIIKQKRFKRTERSIYFRLNNLIDDLHHKTIDFLTKTFKYIILPSFESQGITKKNKIKCVNRDLLQLKHYLFQQRLKAKCDLRNCTLDICTEEYTSKTCGRCGSLNNVGSNDVFNCTKCNLIIDRDVNGARNIAIKRLKEMGG